MAGAQGAGFQGRDWLAGLCYHGVHVIRPLVDGQRTHGLDRHLTAGGRAWGWSNCIVNFNAFRSAMLFRRIGARSGWAIKVETCSSHAVRPGMHSEVRVFFQALHFPSIQDARKLKGHLSGSPYNTCSAATLLEKGSSPVWRSPCTTCAPAETPSGRRAGHGIMRQGEPHVSQILP